MFVIPSKENKTFQQLNNGDTAGNIYSSFNVDFTYNKGRINTTRSLQVANISSIATAGSKTIKVPSTAFTFFDITGNGKTFVSYAGSIMSASSPLGTYTLDTNTSTPDNSSNATYALETDMKVFNGKLYATKAGGAILYKSAGVSAWSTLIAGSGSLGFGGNQMQVYGDRLYYVTPEADKVLSVSTANVVATSGTYTLDLSVFAGTISWIKASSNRIWIGLSKIDGTRGIIFEWDGQSENLWSKNYIIDATGSYSCAIKDDIPYILDNEGRLLAFNGSVFQEVSRLPILSNKKSAYALCHFNGMTTSNDEIILNISGALDSGSTSNESSGYTEELPSGIWKYNKQNGMYHFTSASNTVFASPLVELDYGISYTGDPSNASFIRPSGAVLDVTYADNNNYVGVVYSSSVPALSSGLTLGIYASFGAELDTTSVTGTTSAAITTPFLESNQVTDVWKKIITKYRKFADSGDLIHLKYRTIKQPDLIYSANYTDSLTINIPLLNTISTNQTSRNLIAIGDEVKIISGYGAGSYRTITNIVVSGTTYILTLDSAVNTPTNGALCHILISKWISLPDITDNDLQFTETSLLSKNKDIQVQFKIIAEWQTLNNELYEIMVVNDTEQHAK